MTKSAILSCKILLLLAAFVFFSGCQKDSKEIIQPILLLKSGDFTADGAIIPVGGRLSFGIVATEGSAPLTNLSVFREVHGKRITELDKGIYIESGGLDFIFNAVKSNAEIEIWHFRVFNANRDSATVKLTITLGEGSAYGPVFHFTSVRIGMQENTIFPKYLDLHSGIAYSSENLTGNESLIDFVGFVYKTGGVMSPTLCCPAYSGSSSVTGFYPEIASWSVRNSTLYDYFSSDNGLISNALFDSATNDSLLVTAFNPGNVSGLCKYGYAGRVIPFKTEDGKYGMIKMMHSDTTASGYMEMEIKIQQ